MVRSVERTTSLTEFVEEQTISDQDPTYSFAIEPSITRSISSSRRAYLSDPDHLIRHYFLDSSPQKRVHLRPTIASLIQNCNSMIEILTLSRQQNIKDAYDAGVDLLAEFKSLELHHQAYRYLETSETLLNGSQGIRENQQQAILRLEDFWEILTKGIACAYQVLPEERLELISKISLASQRRIVKTAVIDALVTIAGDMEDSTPIKAFLGRYSSDYEADGYICDYAQDALEDLE